MWDLDIGDIVSFEATSREREVLSEHGFQMVGWVADSRENTALGHRPVMRSSDGTTYICVLGTQGRTAGVAFSATSSGLVVTRLLAKQPHELERIGYVFGEFDDLVAVHQSRCGGAALALSPKRAKKILANLMADDESTLVALAIASRGLLIMQVAVAAAFVGTMVLWAASWGGTDSGRAFGLAVLGSGVGLYTASADVLEAFAKLAVVGCLLAGFLGSVATGVPLIAGVSVGALSGRAYLNLQDVG